MMRYLLLWLAAIILGFAVIAMAEDEPPAPKPEDPSAAAIIDSLGKTVTNIDGMCYEDCLKRGGYSLVCENMCDAGASKNPKKFSEEQFKCYGDCTADRRNGAVFCMGKCKEWAKYREIENTLSPGKAGININADPVKP